MSHAAVMILNDDEFTARMRSFVHAPRFTRKIGCGAMVGGCPERAGYKENPGNVDQNGVLIAA